MSCLGEKTSPPVSAVRAASARSAARSRMFSDGERLPVKTGEDHGIAQLRFSQRLLQIFRARGGRHHLKR